MLDILIMFLIFLLGIICHDLSHFFTRLVLFNDYAKVKVNSFYIKIIPTKNMIKEEKQLFLGFPIISGMIVVCLFMFHYPYEAALALIGYLISCGMDFYNLIKLEVKYK